VNANELDGNFALTGGVLAVEPDGRIESGSNERHHVKGTTMHSNHRRELLAGGTAFVACCFCHGTIAHATEAPRSFDMIAYCCLDCAKCAAYQATIKNDDALRAEVAASWKMKPEQINCLGCKSAKPLFNCSLKKCATPRGLKTCAHCADFPTCKDEQWSKFPKLRETAEAMRTALAG
jgi:hypothetical protein